MNAEELELRRRIFTLDEYATRLHAALTGAEREIARLTAELETVKRERDAFREACDVERVVTLERKAMQWEMLEEMLKRGLRDENGGAEDAQG